MLPCLQVHQETIVVSGAINLSTKTPEVTESKLSAEVVNLSTKQEIKGKAKIQSILFLITMLVI